MSRAAASIYAGRYRPGGSWAGRLGRSNGFAWIVSIVLHVAIFAGLYHFAFREDLMPRRVIIPEARLAGAASPTSPRAPAPLKLTPPRPTVPETPELTLDELPITAITLDAPPAMALPDEPEPQTGAALTGEATAPLAAGPVSSFFGQAGNASKVVYVVDVSASLILYVDDIIREMQRSVEALVPSQQFHVILAKSQVEEAGPRRLVHATAHHKAEASRFLERIRDVPKGKADVIEGMERAFAAGPELVYFLSDGDYDNLGEELPARLKALNPQQHVKITVIGFAPSPRHQRLLDRIAREHGGHLRIVEPEG